MKLIRVYYALTLALLAAGPADAQERIDWSVRDRYRLFDKADAATRSSVESLLTTLGEASGDRPLRPHYDALLATLSGPDAGSLRRSNWRWAQTTGIPGARTYDPTYLSPDSYSISARLKEAPEGECAWVVDGQVAVRAAPCAAPVELVIPSRLEGGRRIGRANVVVTGVVGAEMARQSVEIEDLLVVALGDSFISGEGNPDQRAIFRSIAAGPEFAQPDWPARLDQRLVTRAEWWDEPCHRSLLSWPVLASLSDAARHPRRATTLVHLGCSGAEAGAGLYGPQTKLPGGGDETQGQFKQLGDLLAEAGHRRVDRVVMSIGGNDAGFVPVIAYAVIPPNGFGLGWPGDIVPATLVGLFMNEGGPIRPYRTDNLPLTVLGGLRTSAETRLSRLAGEYGKVQAGLMRLGIDRAVVMQTTYPDILRDAAGDLCRTTLTDTDLKQLETGTHWLDADPEQARRERVFRERHPGNDAGGFESVFGLVPEPFRPETDGRFRFQFQYTPDDRSNPEAGCDMIASASDSEVCKAYWVWRRLNEEVRANESRWRIVSMDTHATRNKGWCEGGDGLTLRLPRTEEVDGQWRWVDGRQPRDFDPYNPALNRWFRTANDSVLTQYGGPERFNQGTIHPTFNAHVAYATEVLAAWYGTPH